MKKNILFALLVVTALMATAAKAEVYCQELCIEECLYDQLPIYQACYEWTHANPVELPLGPLTPAQYEQAVTNGEICSVSLCIQVDDLDCGDSVLVKIEKASGGWETLGYLNTMTFEDSFGIDYGLLPGSDCHLDNHMTETCFNIDPAWLDGLPVKITLSGSLLNPNGIELEKSTLCVDYCPVPAPGAVILGVLGLGLVGGWTRKRMA